MAGCNYKIATNIEMSKEKLREMLNIVEQAEKHASIGQSLTLEINHNTNFVFKELAKIPGLKSSSVDSDTVNT